MTTNKQLLIAVILLTLFFMWILRDKNDYRISDLDRPVENCYSDYMGGVQCD